MPPEVFVGPFLWISTCLDHERTFSIYLRPLSFRLCHVHAGEEDYARPGWTTSRRGQDSPWKSRSTSIVWPIVGSRTAKEQVPDLQNILRFIVRLSSVNGNIDLRWRLTHTHAHLTALFRDYPGKPVPERKNQSGFYWSKRQWIAVASAGPYASLQLAYNVLQFVLGIS